ncbi:Receptor-type guanylate cyclase gcy [Seminavis robusta]|uniref:Receptor-type guanylate cyclase gcy n=1 Tax=Seminavis robusta TaxID=568900 RepID=A0A9N8E4J6_9STRA|nr:Receptor-type guanylate cyclase gcy [Seminavis robusta]|eukprot:Sro659_g182910.1 Receptor-type guanylate cyclase gcy (881) ;mRNA; f:22669-26108
MDLNEWNGDSHHSMEDSAMDVDASEDEDQQETTKYRLAKRDSTHVLVSMLVVMTMIAVTAAVVISSTFAFLSHAEKEDFRHGFTQHASVISESSSFHAMQVVESLEAMSSAITSFTTFTGDKLGYQWPCTTIPDFEMRGLRAGKSAYLEMIGFSPVVGSQDVEKWEAYSTAPNMTGWLQEGKENTPVDVSPQIYDAPDTGTADHSSHTIPFLPAWQMSPLPSDASLINFNLLSEGLYRETFQEMQTNKHATISKVYRDSIVVRKYFDLASHNEHHRHHATHLGQAATSGQTVGQYGDAKLVLPSPATSHEHNNQVADNGDSQLEHEMNATLATTEDMSSSHMDELHPGHRRLNESISHDDHSHHDMDSNGHNDMMTSSSPLSNLSWSMTRPHSLVMAPIYDSFDKHNRILAGVLHGILAWEFYLTDLLPSGVTGIIVVLQNTCAQSSSFELIGPHAEFLGDGDLHDPDYEDMVQVVDFGSIFLPEQGSAVANQCLYSLAIYPSKAFEETYSSNSTAQFVGLLAGIFAALGAFFFVFVWFVQRRQQKVMTVATRTTAIVSQLFPDAVRDRIMEQAESQAQREMEEGRKGSSADDPSNLKSLLNSGAKDYGAPSTTQMTTVNADSATMRKEQLAGGIKILEDAPIADHYPETTVFFGDLVGFTKWSGSRTPHDVFVLLETLYGEFDVIARRRCVFKVETVGDCYVGVVGLPKPRRDHAVVATRFAWDCLRKSSLVFNALAETLGPDTRDLVVRIGLHSGPVTAGVLRGEKGRFQLFGDTVNTASRMESNGRPGSIQCSHDTCQLLVKAGKSDWITKRSNKVVAKGKGEMTTYWLAVKNSSGSHHSGATGQSSELTTSTSDELPVPVPCLLPDENSSMKIAEC